MKVMTTDGLVERELLVCRDLIEEVENARVTATEWLLDGRVVRRDVHVNVLNGIPIGM